MSADPFDVLVVGGGHAGGEAAWAAAKLGARTAMVTFSRDAIGRMSCNPAIGGIGKGQMVREIDALGGLMGRVADESGIQFRMLNRKKGPAVWAPRCQSDRKLYAAALRRWLENCPNLTIIEGAVESIETEAGGGGFDRRVTGVRLSDGAIIRAENVIITSGTFLRALMHCGQSKTSGGRYDEPAANGLSVALERLGLELGRLKTGTPPRLDRTSLDYDKLAVQSADDSPVPFSFMTDRIAQPQLDCWITYTNPAVHDMIRANLHRAPMYSGQIRSHGPRYCPSIEDKVVRFADKQRHQIFLEPEGYDSDRIYANGISTSLPRDVQEKMVRAIKGLEHARIVQWGYAVEYDFVPPQQIDASLMTKRIEGLFLAGQINGTSGYEEAAGQGLLAGVNAARRRLGKPPVVLRRDQAYLGVMIDDLVTRGVTEPYRMFTSRAEYRMVLRYDNADARLSPLGREIGLVDDQRWQRFESKQARFQGLMTALQTLSYDGKRLVDWLKRPEEDGTRFAAVFESIADYQREADVWAGALIEIKYAGYVRRQDQIIQRFRAMESRAIPSDIDYAAIPQLRREAVERWTTIGPRNFGQAARVSGIHPTDVSMLMVYLASRQRKSCAATH